MNYETDYDQRSPRGSEKKNAHKCNNMQYFDRKVKSILLKSSISFSKSYKYYFLQFPIHQVWSKFYLKRSTVQCILLVITVGYCISSKQPSPEA